MAEPIDMLIWSWIRVVPSNYVLDGVQISHEKGTVEAVTSGFPRTLPNTIPSGGPWPQMQSCHMKFSQWKSPCEAAMRPFVKLFWQLVFVNVVWKAITRNDIHCPLLKRSRFKKWNHARVLGLPSQCQWLSTLGRFCKQDYGNIGLINCRLWSFQLRRVPYSYHTCSVHF